MMETAVEERQETLKRLGVGVSYGGKAFLTKVQIGRGRSETIGEDSAVMCGMSNGGLLTFVVFGLAQYVLPYGADPTTIIQGRVPDRIRVNSDRSLLNQVAAITLRYEVRCTVTRHMYDAVLVFGTGECDNTWPMRDKAADLATELAGVL